MSRTGRIALAVCAWLIAFVLYGSAFTGLFGYDPLGATEVVAAAILLIGGVAATYMGCRFARLCRSGKQRRLGAQGRRDARNLAGVSCALAALGMAFALYGTVPQQRGHVPTGVFAAGIAVVVACAAVAVACWGPRRQLRRAREKRELACTADELARRVAAVEDALPSVVADLFGGWVPRRLDIADDRAGAPTVDGAWVRMGTRGAVFDLDQKELAAYVCTDAALIARACARRDAAEAAGDLANPDGADDRATVPGRFVYNKVHVVRGGTGSSGALDKLGGLDEASLTARLLEDLLFCRKIFSYEDLRVELRPVGAGMGAGAVACRVSFKATLV